MRLYIIILVGLSLILTLLGTITNKWYKNSSNESYQGLWKYCKRLSSVSSTKIYNCHRQSYCRSQGLSVSAIILLFISFILLIINFYRKNNHLLAYLNVLILLICTLLLIFSYLLYPRNIHLKQFGYSIYFMLCSSIIVLITTGLTTFSARTIQYSTTSI